MQQVSTTYRTKFFNIHFFQPTLIRPLLPEQAMRVGLRIFNPKELQKVTSEEKHESSEAENMQLPIERMSPPFQLAFPVMDVQGKETCALCEYMLHFLQEELSKPSAEVKWAYTFFFWEHWDNVRLFFRTPSRKFARNFPSLYETSVKNSSTLMEMLLWLF